MRRVLFTALLAVASASIATSTCAADIISYGTSTAKEVPITSTEPKFDWNGFYAGIYGAYRQSAVAGSQYGLGIDLGVNTTFNFVLAGAEVAVEGLGGDAGTTAHVQGLGRAGMLVTDNALVYGAAGYGVDTGAPSDGSALLGGGLEYAITDSLTVRGQYLHGFSASGNNPKDEVTLGAQFHF